MRNQETDEQTGDNTEYYPEVLWKSVKLPALAVEQFTGGASHLGSGLPRQDSQKGATGTPTNATVDSTVDSYVRSGMETRRTPNPQIRVRLPADMLRHRQHLMRSGGVCSGRSEPAGRKVGSFVRHCIAIWLPTNHSIAGCVRGILRRSIYLFGRRAPTPCR